MAHYKASLDIKEKLYGNDSAPFAVVLDSLGDCYTTIGDYTEADTCYKKAINIFKRKGAKTPGEHSAYLMAYEHLTEILITNNQLDDALTCNQESYKLAMKPGTRLSYAEAVIEQRVRIFERLRRDPKEIEALKIEKDNLKQSGKFI